MRLQLWLHVYKTQEGKRENCPLLVGRGFMLGALWLGCRRSAKGEGSSAEEGQAVEDFELGMVPRGLEKGLCTRGQSAITPSSAGWAPRSLG